MGVSFFIIFIDMRRTIILIFLGFLLTSCGSGMYYFSTINHEPEYIGDVRVDKIESRMDLNWKLRTDNQFRWDFANYAQNQPLSWYYDNSWELGLYRGNFTAFDFYWNRNQLWWDWAFGYPYNYGWNSWYPFGYDRWGWNYGFRNSWTWGYNPYRWNRLPNHRNPNYRRNEIVNRNVVRTQGRRGSVNTQVRPVRTRSNNQLDNDIRRLRNNNVKVRVINDVREGRRVVPNSNTPKRVIQRPNTRTPQRTQVRQPQPIRRVQPPQRTQVREAVKQTQPTRRSSSNQIKQND